MIEKRELFEEFASFWLVNITSLNLYGIIEKLENEKIENIQILEQKYIEKFEKISISDISDIETIKIYWEYKEKFSIEIFFWWSFSNYINIKQLKYSENEKEEIKDLKLLMFELKKILDCKERTIFKFILNSINSAFLTITFLLWLLLFLNFIIWFLNDDFLKITKYSFWIFIIISISYNYLIDNFFMKNKFRNFDKNFSKKYWKDIILIIIWAIASTIFSIIWALIQKYFNLI